MVCQHQRRAKINQKYATHDVTVAANVICPWARDTDFNNSQQPLLDRMWKVLVNRSWNCQDSLSRPRPIFCTPGASRPTAWSWGLYHLLQIKVMNFCHPSMAPRLHLWVLCYWHWETICFARPTEDMER